MARENQFSTTLPKALEAQINDITAITAPGASFPARLRALIAEVQTYRNVIFVPSNTSYPLAIAPLANHRQSQAMTVIGAVNAPVGMFPYHCPFIFPNAQ